MRRMPPMLRADRATGQIRQRSVHEEDGKRGLNRTGSFLLRSQRNTSNNQFQVVFSGNSLLPKSPSCSKSLLPKSPVAKSLLPKACLMPQPFDLTRRAMRRFRRNRARGSAAVEFALVAPIFFGLLFAIIECGDGVHLRAKCC